jgi:hypothetical protein
MKNQPVKQLLSDDIVTVFQVDNKRQFIYVQKTEMMRNVGVSSEEIYPQEAFCF